MMNLPAEIFASLLLIVAFWLLARKPKDI